MLSLKKSQEYSMDRVLDHVRLASDFDRGKHIVSGYPWWDELLGGGWKRGSILELGLPFGAGAREFLLRLLSKTVVQRMLWIYPAQYWNQSLKVYPPVWAAYGIDLQTIRFARTQSAVRDLKPIWMSSVFDLIICDGTHLWSQGDWAFVAHQARIHGYAVIALHPYFLSKSLGNIWANVRLNIEANYCHKERRMQFYYREIRGVYPLNKHRSEYTNGIIFSGRACS